MTKRPDKKQEQTINDRVDHVSDDVKRVPDVILEEVQPLIFDLPRQGLPKAVTNVSKASIRLPDVLIEE